MAPRVLDMTPTTKTMSRRAPASPAVTDDYVQTTEKKIHGINRSLRERYIALVEQASSPGVDHKRCEFLRDQIAQEFIEANAAFAAAMVTKVSPVGEREDLYQEALVTMWEHFLTWDPDKALFTTYAFNSMLGDVGRAKVRATNEGSYGDHQARSQTLAAASRLNAKLGRRPSLAELVEETGLTTDTVRRVLRPSATSLDRPVRPGDSDAPATLGEMLADSRQAPPASLEDLWHQRLKAATDNLSMQDTLIVLRRNGIDGWPAETLQQVGKWLGLGREPVRRAEAAAEATFLANGTPLPTVE
jgi:RNA polymerase nonessential primary-like sigma factor